MSDSHSAADTRAARLSETHCAAEALLESGLAKQRMASFLRADQRDKWQMDEVSGYYWYLYALVAVAKPKMVVELGRCLGSSTLFMFGALAEDAHLISIDIEERASELSHSIGDSRLQIAIGNDLDPELVQSLGLTGIDFLFVDTDHTNAQATKEWQMYLPLLSENALVAFDDITMNDMGAFWSALDCPKLETGTRYHYTGFGLAAPGRPV